VSAAIARDSARYLSANRFRNLILVARIEALTRASFN
jgi:hypothetical protein